MNASVLSSQTLFDVLRRTAVRHPHKPGIKYGKEGWTYSEFLRLCQSAASGLQAQGIKPGDRVAVLSRNSNAFAVARFAISAIGAVLVPVNFNLNVEESAFILQHSGARMLLFGDTETDKAQALKPLCPAIEQVVWLSMEGNSPAGVTAFSELVACTAPVSYPVIDSGSPAQIIYTSGTESAPKGAVLSHAAVIWQYASILVDAEVAEQDVLLNALPMYHCAQLDCFLGPAIQAGASNVITDDPSPKNLLSLLEQEAITSFFAPPTVWISLLRHPRFDDTDLSALRKGYYGASIMPVEVLKEIQQRLPQLSLWNLYGQTEIAPVATILKPRDQIRKAGSAGKPVLNVETRVVDDTMDDVAVGEIGEVVHRSPQLLTEYYNNPDKTAEAFSGGWFHSGDLATIDEEGYLTIVDRKKDMINSGGENVSSREVEECIYQLPGVAEVAVIGLPHPRWVEAVTAVVVAKSDNTLTEPQIIEHCGKSLAGFKQPKAVVFVDDLPRNPSGKILKRDLRETLGSLFISA